MHIADLRPDDEPTIRQVAVLLVEGFREQAPDAWPTFDAALAEVRESLAPERISRIAVDEQGVILGWVGGIPQYDGRVWELHPLVVAPAARRQGVGRALVANLEAEARARGGLTLWLGADDETGQTSLAGADLYERLPEQLAAIENRGGHPYPFYQRLGFSIVGVLPDANGSGKPDIFLAKRLAGGRARSALSAGPSTIAHAVAQAGSEDWGRRMTDARSRDRVASGSPYEPTVGFCRALRVGERVLVAGTAPIWPDGSCDPDPRVQARRCFEIILDALRQLGGEPHHVVRTRMFITDASYGDAVGAAHGEVFAAVRPVATMVVVAGLLDPRWKVEIEAEAILD